MLTKLIDTSFSSNEGEPQVTIIDLDNTKGLLKQAADSNIMEFASGIKPEPNKIYLHIIALSAGQYMGANRNFDYFPEENLIASHHTFVTEPAHVFRNHINKNPDIALGKVIFSVYNPRMHRVELIAEVDTNKAPDIKQRIENGDWPATSMATKTPWDQCSTCFNKAHNKQEYCEHIRNDLGKVYPNGHKVQLLNNAPLRFIDISIVFRPADITSSVLQKVASTEAQPTGFEASSVYAAEMEGLDKIADTTTVKKASLGKISEHIKELEGDVAAMDDTLDTMLAKLKDPGTDTISILKNYKLNDVFSTMAHLGISPSISYLAELISQKLMGDNGTGLGVVAASMINSIGNENIPAFNKDFGEVTDPNFGIVNVLIPEVPGSSMLPEHVEKRAYTYYNPTSILPSRTTADTGYAMNGPIIEPTPYEIFKQQQMSQPASNPSGIFKTFTHLLAIGSAALAAKWYITKVIEQKMAEKQMQDLQDRAKITIIKSAMDYTLCYKLAKAAMLQTFKKTVKPKHL